jgi:hypothetical protein
VSALSCQHFELAFLAAGKPTGGCRQYGNIIRNDRYRSSGVFTSMPGTSE